MGEYSSEYARSEVERVSKAQRDLESRTEGRNPTRDEDRLDDHYVQQKIAWEKALMDCVNRERRNAPVSESVSATIPRYLHELRQLELD